MVFKASNPSLTDHERQLLLEYKAKETAGGAKISVPGLEQLPGGQEEQHEKDGSRNKNKANKAKSLGSKTAAAAQDADGYEKAMPKHGDALWHKFVSVVQENPGQMLR